MNLISPGSILIVDDDVDAGQNLGDILSDIGYSVGIATDGLMALDLARQQRFDLALLDLKMPGMDGLTLSRRLKELSASTIVILTTAYATTATVAEAQKHGVWRVFAKPLDLASVIPCLVEAAELPLVLLVDDDTDLCHSLGDVLVDKGYHVTSAMKVDDVLNLVRHNEFDVVLIDMKLPDCFGDDVFRQVRKISGATRVVLSTGYRTEMDERIERSLSAGADAVCYKPFKIPELLRILHRLTASS